MRVFKAILLVIFVVAIVIFTIQNMEIVNMRFLNWKLEIPLSMASVSLYILGAISGGLFFWVLKKLSFKDADKKTK